MGAPCAGCVRGRRRWKCPTKCHRHCARAGLRALVVEEGGRGTTQKQSPQFATCSTRVSPRQGEDADGGT
eukprot:gene29315-52488_t